MGRVSRLLPQHQSAGHPPPPQQHADRTAAGGPKAGLAAASLGAALSRLGALWLAGAKVAEALTNRQSSTIPL